MLTLRKVSLIAAAVALAGCAQIEVRDADARPGGTVTTYDANRQAAVGWIPQAGVVNKAPGIDHWYRIKVIAPEGATECRSGNFFSKGGPQAKGKPDANRVVMLTGRQGDRTAHIECDTPSGAVKRSVPASIYRLPPPQDAPPHIMKQIEKTRRETHVLPPLVHVDPRDPGAEGRWTAFAAEACPVATPLPSIEHGYVCVPGMLDKFKAVDLGLAAG